MSTDTQYIEDEEGLVDRKTKDQILNLRAQIDDDERTLFVDRMSDPEYQLTIAHAVQYWGISVRQYLRGIKRLWADNQDELDLRNVEHYWEDINLGEETLVPPDKDGYKFSTIAKTSAPNKTIKQHLNLPPDAELPQPVTVEFNGLSSILNTTIVSHEWVVKTDTSGPPPSHDTIHLSRDSPVPKHVLENAVEAADSFLQQAGIGFEIAVPDYMGGDEPGL